MSQAVATRPVSPATPIAKVTSVDDLLAHPHFATVITEALPGNVTPARMVSICSNAVEKIPALKRAHPAQLFGTFIACAGLGIEPNTPMMQAWILPFDVHKGRGDNRQYVRTDLNLIIGYQGMVDLAYRSPRVIGIHADAVWDYEIEAGAFNYQKGTDSFLHHKPIGDRVPPERVLHTSGEGLPAEYYAVIKLSGGGHEFDVMNLAQVHRIRNGSQGFQAALKSYDYAVNDGKNPWWSAGYAKAPWIAHPVAMGVKTVLRRAYKLIPKTPEMASAALLDEAGDRNRVRWDRVIDGKAFAADAWEMAETESGPDDQDTGGAFALRDQGGAGPVVAPARPDQGAKAPGPAAPRSETRSRPAVKVVGAQAEPTGDEPPPHPGSVPAQRSEPAGRVPEPVKTGEPGVPVPAAPAPSPAPTPAPVGPPDPGEEYPATDAVGEPAPDVAGKPLVFGAATAFAEWLAAQLDRRPSDMQALLEHNADSIANAELDEGAAQTIAAACRRAEQVPARGAARSEQAAPERPDPSAEPGPNWVVEIPVTPKGSPHWPNYAAACRASLDGRVKSEADLAAWIAANEPRYAGKTVGASIAKHIAETRARLGLSDGGAEPPAAPGPAPVAAPPVRDKAPPGAPSSAVPDDRARAETALGYLKEQLTSHTRNAADLNLFETHTGLVNKVSQIKPFPDLFAEYQRVLAQRRAEFGAQ